MSCSSDLFGILQRLTYWIPKVTQNNFLIHSNILQLGFHAKNNMTCSPLSYHSNMITCACQQEWENIFVKCLQATILYTCDFMFFMFASSVTLVSLRNVAFYCTSVGTATCNLSVHRGSTTVISTAAAIKLW